MANILSLLSSDLDVVNAKMGLLFDAISCKYCLILDVEGFSTLGHFKLLSQCMWILGLRESKWNSSVCSVDLTPFVFSHFYEIIMFSSLVNFDSNSLRFGIKAVFYTCFNNLLGLVSREKFLRRALRATCFNNEGDYSYGDLQFKRLLKLHFKSLQ